ncbi:hypothetical protein ACIOWI_29545 [Streptomyces sp. NPDC087659]|uniref:hypothetical protein n=1 Tax=Streptomyces sp. NPDC087659 TaxID=3365801 RepID=UPI003828C633
MNVTFLRRGTGAHRAATPAELRTENRELREFRTAADDYFARLTEDRDAVHEAFEAEQQLRIEAETVVACMARRIDELEAELANVRAVSVPTPHRDTSDPVDQATEPTGIPVTSLRLAFGLPTASPGV